MRQIAVLVLMLGLSTAGFAQGVQSGGQQKEPSKKSEPQQTSENPPSNVIRPELMNVVNAMSASVGGIRVIGLGWADLPNGRELQMTVLDNHGLRWVLGASQVTAKPTTKLCFGGSGEALVAVDAKTEPKYGMLNGKPINEIVGQAVNAGLAEINKSLTEQNVPSPARIKSIAVFDTQDTVFVVSWDSAISPEVIKGKFAIDVKGKPRALPKEE